MDDLERIQSHLGMQGQWGKLLNFKDKSELLVVAELPKGMVALGGKRPGLQQLKHLPRYPLKYPTQNLQAYLT